jgi:hypothetical protein
MDQCKREVGGRIAEEQMKRENHGTNENQCTIYWDITLKMETICSSETSVDF